VNSPVCQLGRLALGDFHGIVVATRNLGVELLLGQLDLVRTEFRLSEDLQENLEHVTKISLQARPGNRGRIRSTGGFDSCRPRLQVIVELVSCFTLRAAGAPSLAVNADQPDLVGGFFSRTTTDLREPVDEG
jgi:hypothetical protein